MKKIAKAALVLLLAFGMLAGCADSGKYELPYYRQAAEDALNKSLYYQNDMTVVGADPSVVYCDDESDEENYGWFFMYVTGDTKSLNVYKSRNMVDWELAGKAFAPEADSWAQQQVYAPECIYDREEKKYYLFFTANDSVLRPDKLFFNSRAEEAEYDAAASEIKGYSYKKVVAEMDAEREKYVGAESYEGLSAEQLASVQELIADFDAKSAEIEANTALDKDEKKKEIRVYGRKILISIRTIKIETVSYINGFSICVAVADSPVGPFVQYTNVEGAEGYDPAKRAIGIDDAFMKHEDMACVPVETRILPVMTQIDVNPFVDPVTGKKYMYFSNTYYKQEYIFGIEMGDSWTSDPKWDTLVPLIRNKYKTVSGGERTDYNETRDIDEGPHMYYDSVSQDYYLTFSFNGSFSRDYAVAQAIGDSPLGEFTKVDRADGGLVISSDFSWDHVAAPGHHCFVNYGGKTYIVYQGLYDRAGGTEVQSKRGICVDEIKFITNNDGVRLLYANGPSYAPMPVIGSDAVYRNIAEDAEVKATNSADGADASVLNDGLITYTLYHDLVSEYNTKKGKTEITLTFDDYRTVRGLMIFNSKNLDTAFEGIKRIELDFTKTDSDGKTVTGTAFIKDLVFDMARYTTNWGDGVEESARPGGSVAVEFDELSVKTIRITIDSDKPVAVSEIFVLGK